jgi:RNA polymerase primary sigma factor
MLMTVDSPAITDSDSRAIDSLSHETREILRSEIQFIHNSKFGDVDAEHEILDSDDRFSPENAPKARVPKDLPAHLARLCETELLTADEERSVFRRMNYLKFRANSIRSTLDPQNPDEGAISTIETYLTTALIIRDHIVNANMRLAISIVKKFVTPQLSFDDLLSDGIWALVHCVDKFDYDRGFRFSTYAYRSIARSSYRKITDLQKESARYLNSGGDESRFDIEDEGSTSSMDDRTWSTLRDLLAGMMHKLDCREQFVVSGRYALGVHRKIRTFQSLADELGVSKERTRQLEQRAVGKLQKMAASVDLDDVVTPAFA